MEKKIKNGLLHCHTDNSRKDSPLTVTELVETAVSLGCPAIASTEHGTLMGMDSFISVCKENNVKPILGVEAYVKEENGLVRNHLILMAINNIGYKAISKAVTLSNTRLENEFPLMNKEMIQKCFGNESDSYGTVVATSACMNGVLASIIRNNDIVQNLILKKKKLIGNISSPNDDDYIKNKEIQTQLNDSLVFLKNEKTKLKALANRPFKKKENALEKLRKANSPDFSKYEQELLAEKEESKDAVKQLVQIEKEILSKTSNLKTLNEILKTCETQHEKFKKINDEIANLESLIKNEDVLYQEALEEIKFYKDVFGENFYIELQYHGIKEEEYCMKILAKLAKEENIPVVAANDVHIKDNSKESIRARQLVTSLRFNKFKPLRDGDSELYIKTDEELKEALLKILPEDIVNKAMKNIGEIVSKCNINLEKESHYPKFPITNGENSTERLIRLAKEGIPDRYPGEEWNQEKQERFYYEIDVIKKLGLCDYLCIVQDFIEYGRLLGFLPDKEIDDAPLSIQELSSYIIEHSYQVGEGIGPGRGSGAGSCILYLTGITNVDPFRYNLVFERFLNLERVSMADIDTDFKTNIRNKVVSYVRNKYGENAVCCILTKGVRQAKGSIRDAARILGGELYQDELRFKDLADSMCKSIPKGMLVFKDCEDVLREIYRNNENAIKILDNAILIEGKITNLGMHAAGVIISDNDDVSEYTPLMWDTENTTWKCQCDMVQAEEKGLLKMDFLGLKNLDIITDTFRYIYKRTGKVLKFNQIPFLEDVFDKILAKGLTNSVFQFESAGMKNMLKKFKPKTIDDIILLVAAYRPGPMQYLEEIINIKLGKSKIKYNIMELEPILSTTYGKIIYQEQIMQIAQKLAGYTLGQADLLRRAMSKKKTYVMETERKSFVYGDEEKGIEGCVKRGIEEAKANKLYDEMIDFAKYAFNKSHAAAYAIIAYVTAYLKTYYAIEYMTSVMNHSENKKISGLINDCKTFQIAVLPPDINKSEFGYTITNEDEIIFGLNSVKDVGIDIRSTIDERKRNGKFVSFKDYMIRGHRNKTSTETLIKVGAFDCFCKNRQALLQTYPKFEKEVKKINDYNKKIQALNTSNFSEQTIKSKFNTISEKIEKIKMQMGYITIPNFNENKQESLAYEKNFLGVYVSSHPLNDYKMYDFDTMIEDIYETNKITVMGIITELNFTTTKKDKKEMAIFVLEDKTATVKVCCFPKTFAKIKSKIVDGNVIRITGKCEENVDYEEFTIFPEEIDNIEVNKAPIVITVSSIADYINIHPLLSIYKADSQKDGYPALVFDKLTNEFRELTMFLNRDIIYNTIGINAEAY